MWTWLVREDWIWVPVQQSNAVDRSQLQHVRQLHDRPSVLGRPFGLWRRLEVGPDLKLRPACSHTSLTYKPPEKTCTGLKSPRFYKVKPSAQCYKLMFTWQIYRSMSPVVTTLCGFMACSIDWRPKVQNHVQMRTRCLVCGISGARLLKRWSWSMVEGMAQMHQLDTMLSVSLTNPSPVHSLSDWRPFLMAFLCLTASCCRWTRSVCVVKYGSEALKWCDDKTSFSLWYSTKKKNTEKYKSRLSS